MGQTATASISTSLSFVLEILNDCVFQEGSILVLAQYSLRDPVKLILTHPCMLLILTLSFIRQAKLEKSKCVSTCVVMES